MSLCIRIICIIQPAVASHSFHSVKFISNYPHNGSVLCEYTTYLRITQLAGYFIGSPIDGTAQLALSTRCCRLQFQLQFKLQLLFRQHTILTVLPRGSVSASIPSPVSLPVRPLLRQSISLSSIQSVRLLSIGSPSLSTAADSPRGREGGGDGRSSLVWLISRRQRCEVNPLHALQQIQQVTDRRENESQVKCGISGVGKV